MHATLAARQPGAMPSKAGMEAAISGAAYTAIKRLLPGALALLDDLLVSTRVNNQSAAFITGVAAASQVLTARSQDGFAAPVPPNIDFPAPPNPFLNPPMSTTVVTTCAATKIDTWQQLKVPAVKDFTPALGAVFPPNNYDSIASKVGCRHMQEACWQCAACLAAACQHQSQCALTCAQLVYLCQCARPLSCVRHLLSPTVPACEQHQQVGACSHHVDLLVPPCRPKNSWSIVPPLPSPAPLPLLLIWPVACLGPTCSTTSRRMQGSMQRCRR